MVIANFYGQKDTYKTVSGLWQWDYGQTLRIQGLNLPPAVEIHFSLQQSGGEAVTRIGITKDGVTDVVIPDSLLENDGKSVDYYIYAFVYISDGDSGQTEYRITLSVKSRPKPDAWSGSGETTMGRIMEAVNQIADGKADSLEYKNNVLRLLAGEKELAHVTITGDSGGGTDAREIELRKGELSLQWRYVGDQEWTDLISLAEITGSEGPAGADGHPGADGKDGHDGEDGITPHIGDNGNWYLGETDTGKPSRGETGPAGEPGLDGVNGADGKSAYQFAQEGGYTGTAEEFAVLVGKQIQQNKEDISKLSEEIADKAILENGVIKFYKTATEEGEADTELFNVDLSSIGGSGGLDLENLTLSVSQVGEYQRLSMSDGTTIKTVDIPITAITDNQVQTAVNTWLNEHPEAIDTVDKASLFGINEFNVEYSISQLGYKTDGSRVSWSNLYSTKKYDCTRIEEFICEKVGGQIFNVNNKFPSVIFFDENDSVISYILPDIQLSGTSYTYTGTVKVPTEAKYVAFNKAKGTDFESTNIIHWVQREIGEEIKTVKELDLFANAKVNINKVLIENSKKLTDCVPCVGELEVRGENAEIYVFGKNRCPIFPVQSFESNGITFAVDEFGKITANGTATSTSASGYLYWDSYFRYEPNTYYALLKASDEDTTEYTLSASPNNLGLYNNNHRESYTISSAIPPAKQSDDVSKCHIKFDKLTVGQILDNVEITISLQTEGRVAKHYISEEPQKIVHSNGYATYKVHLEKGSEIAVIREGTTDIKLTYVTHPNDFYEETEGGIVERNTVNTSWWGWNLPDGDAFFRYNCNPYYWPQYKEVVGPMLIRGQLVVGKNKPNLGGGAYDSTVPARYGFHIFEGIGNEDDGKRLTMLGGKFKDTCAIFYFKTPYDGDDSNLEGSVSYGWVQLGSDNVRKGVWFNEDNSRFHVPIVFDLNVGNIEGNTDEIEIANSEKYNVDFRTEEKYPIGTMYYNSTMGKIRVKTPSGWKSLAFEE